VEQSHRLRPKPGHQAASSPASGLRNHGIDGIETTATFKTRGLRQHRLYGRASLTPEVIALGARTADSGPAEMVRCHDKGATTMTDINSIAARYIELWNERNASRRRDMLAANWTENASYVDPLMKGDGRSGIDALIEGVQKRFPDFRFKLLGKVDGYGDRVRFCWGLGPEGADSPIKGTDFAVIDDGRIRSITGFLDQVPQGAA
jgi:SnoaL-like domain